MLHNAAGAGSSVWNVPSQSIPSGAEAGAAVAAPEQQCWPLVAALAPHRHRRAGLRREQHHTHTASLEMLPVMGASPCPWYQLPPVVLTD